MADESPRPDSQIHQEVVAELASDPSVSASIVNELKVGLRSAVEPTDTVLQAVRLTRGVRDVADHLRVEPSGRTES